jgi:hypothetical protein
MWCIPPEQDAEFVCAMENVPAVYQQPYDPEKPTVCFDEKSKQLVGETVLRLAIPDRRRADQAPPLISEDSTGMTQ